MGKLAYFVHGIKKLFSTKAIHARLCYEDKELKGTFEGKDKKAQAFAVGELLAKKAESKKIKAVVFDRGGYLYTGRVASLADGARKGGLEF